MAVRGIHHVAVAVDDLDAAIETYGRLFGAELEHRDTVSEQGVEAAAVLVGESRIELLAATAEDTPVGRFLARRGPGMHHVAYEVDDLEAQLARARRAGSRADRPRAAPRVVRHAGAFVNPTRSTASWRSW